MQAVSEHVFAVAQYFYQNLGKLEHGNGRPLAEIYGGVKFEACADQGGVVTFNIMRSDGAYIGYSEVKLLVVWPSLVCSVRCLY